MQKAGFLISRLNVEIALCFMIRSKMLKILKSSVFTMNASRHCCSLQLSIGRWNLFRKSLRCEKFQLVFEVQQVFLLTLNPYKPGVLFMGYRQTE